LLLELDKTKLVGTFARNRLKKFIKRDRYFYSPKDVLNRESKSKESSSKDNKAENTINTKKEDVIV
jgi:hypothetical protein